MGHRCGDRAAGLPRLIVTEAAAIGIARCRAFLLAKDDRAAARAGAIIAERLLSHEHRPLLGRPFSTDTDLRELVIGFGRSGYVGLYRFDEERDLIVVLAFRHQREAGY